MKNINEIRREIRKIILIEPYDKKWFNVHKPIAEFLSINENYNIDENIHQYIFDKILTVEYRNYIIFIDSFYL